MAAAAQDTLAFEKEPWLQFSGFLEDLPSVTFKSWSDSVYAGNLIHNRLNFHATIKDRLTARMEIRNRIFAGTQIQQVPSFGKMIDAYPGYWDMSKVWVDQEGLVVHSVIDRLLLQYATNKWVITGGRQRINWGINNIWNPNDIFNTYNYLDFDYVERPGNDAIRVQHFMQQDKSIELAFKPGRFGGEAIASALYKFNHKKYDYQLLGGMYMTDIVVGGGWAGNIHNAGFKGEVSYFHPYDNITDTSGVLSLSLMADETFKNEWYVSLAALYNSNPMDFDGTIRSFSFVSLSAKQLFPFRYTFYAGAMKTFSPITSTQFSVTYSPTYNTLIIFPSLAWTIEENFVLDFTAQLFYSNQTGIYRSEGNAVFLRGKWNF